VNVNAGERAALLQGFESYDELSAAVDERTREIVDRRRRSAIVRRRGWLVRRMLLAADVIGLLLALALAEWIVGVRSSAGAIGVRAEVLVFLATLPGWVVAAKLYGLYDRDEERTGHTTIDDFTRVFQMVTVCTWLFWAGSYLTGLAHPTAPKLVAFWIAAIALVTLARVAARTAARRHIAYVQNAIIVGAGEIGQLVARKLLHHPEYGVNLVGFVDSDPKGLRDDLERVALLGTPDRLVPLIRLFDVERVIVAFSRDSHADTIELIRTLGNLNVQVDLVPRLFEVVGPNVAVHTIEGLPLVGLPPARISRSSRAIKRAIDVLGALAGLLVSAPLFAYAAWRIKRESPGPVFFRQRRLGLAMREFTALKFRTMRVDTDESQHRDYIRQIMTAQATPSENGIYKLDRSDAVTPFGRWLRKSSLDELPQLINVLAGDMSLVGPRPCIPYETETFAPHHFERFLVPQGITGLWQVTARAHSTFAEALDMDVAYVRSWSLRLDLALLFKTPLQLVRRQGTA
jgi:exopolysaccharide biosynthesis polyprenyl glycosylphosphotransferase